MRSRTPIVFRGVRGVRRSPATPWPSLPILPPFMERTPPLREPGRRRCRVTSPAKGPWVTDSDDDRADAGAWEAERERILEPGQPSALADIRKALTGR